MSAWIAGRPKCRSRIAFAASLDALVVAVQQLAQALHGARRQLAQLGLDYCRDAGPVARIGAATRQPMAVFVAFQYRSPSLWAGRTVDQTGTLILPYGAALSG